MNIAIDVILAVICAVIIIFHTCRGFLKALLGFARLVASVAVSWYFTPLLFREKPYVTRLMAYVLFFVGAFIVFSIVSIIIYRIFELPGLNAANKLLGFALGCVCAYIIVSVLACVVTVFANLFGETVRKELAESTYFYRFFENNGIFSLIDKLYK